MAKCLWLGKANKTWSFRGGKNISKISVGKPVEGSLNDQKIKTAKDRFTMGCICKNCYLAFCLDFGIKIDDDNNKQFRFIVQTMFSSVIDLFYTVNLIQNVHYYANLKYICNYL